MKFKIPVDVTILSPLSFKRPEDFLDAVQTFCDLLPGLIPEKWGWEEPLNQTFEVNNLHKLVHANGTCESFSWQRKKQPKAEGAFHTRWCSGSPKVRDTHAIINFTIELDRVEQDALVKYLKQSSIRSKADFAFIDALVEPYKNFAREGRSATYGEQFFLVTHVLRHWLPDVFWGTVFGPAYVRFFGKENLLTAPAYIVEELGPEMIYVQLTEKITDTAENYPEVQACRQRFKEHFHNNAFFISGKGYDRLERGPIGDVFTVPNFELIPD